MMFTDSKYNDPASHDVDLNAFIQRAADQQRKLSEASAKDEEIHELKKRIKKLEKKIDDLDKGINKLIECNNDLVDVVTSLQTTCKDNKDNIESLYGITTSDMSLFFEIINKLEDEMKNKLDKKPEPGLRRCY